MDDFTDGVGKGGKRMSTFGIATMILGFLAMLVFATALSAVCLLLIPARARAQDAHYWTNQYGPRASLLGGAVIGSIDDVSGTFYNPGSLALAESLPFALSTSIYEYENVVLEDGAGRDVDLGTTRTGVRPSLIAGTITSELLGSDVLAYSVLTRHSTTSDVAVQVIASGAELPSGLNLEHLAGVARIESRTSDLWAGLSYSHAFSSSFGAGLTLYGAQRSQRRRREGIATSIATDGSPSVSIDMRGGSYSAFRTLAKLGGYFASGSVSAGVTVTTPSLQVAGSGEFGINGAIVNSDTTRLVADVQTDLSAKYKSPLSVGLGFGWQIGKARINASGEWFDAIDPYMVMAGEEFDAQVPAEVRSFEVVQEVDDVFNWAVGVGYSLTESSTWYGSFATDNAAVTDDIERADLSIQAFDLYSAFLGTEFAVTRARVTLGAGYGWGSHPADRLADRIGGEEVEPQYVYKRLRVLFGFELVTN